VYLFPKYATRTDKDEILQVHVLLIINLESQRVGEDRTLLFDVGISGSVLINDDADRLNSYNIWDYADGQDSYQKSMLIDLTQPPDKVSRFVSTCI